MKDENYELLMKLYYSPKAIVLEEKYSIEADLLESLSYLKILIEDRESLRAEIKESLWNAALMSFFRCFGSGVRTKLSKNIFRVLPGEPIKFFDYLKDLRDKHVAHSVSQLDIVRVVATIDPKAEKIVGNGKLHIRRVLENQQHVVQLSDFCKIGLNAISNEIKALQQEIDIELSNIAYSEAISWKDAVHTIPDPVIAAKTSRKKRV